MTDDDATRSGIVSALARLWDAGLGDRDHLLIYYAGHGYQEKATVNP